MKFIKIYGLNRCGTNYVEWLLRHNFKNVNVLYDANILGWKHGPPVYDVDWTGRNWDESTIPEPHMTRIINTYMDVIKPYRAELEEAVKNNEILHVFVFKNPYSWYLSFDRSSTKNHLALPLDMNKLNLWNERNAQFLEYHDKFPERSIIIRYEDFYNKPFYSVLERVRDAFNIEPNETWVNQNKTINPRQGILHTNFSIEYYSKELYLNVIPEEQKMVFRNTIDKDLLNRLDYKL